MSSLIFDYICTFLITKCTHQHPICIFIDFSLTISWKCLDKQCLFHLQQVDRFEGLKNIFFCKFGLKFCSKLAKNLWSGNYCGIIFCSIFLQCHMDFGFSIVLKGVFLSPLVLLLETSFVLISVNSTIHWVCWVLLFVCVCVVLQWKVS